MTNIAVVEVVEVGNAAVQPRRYDRAARQQHRARRAVIGAHGTVLGDATTELGDGHHQGAVPLSGRPHVARERADRLAQLLQDATMTAELFDVSVEPRDGHVEDPGREPGDDHPADQPERLRETERRVVRARRDALGRVDAVGQRYRLPAELPDALQRVVRARRRRGAARQPAKLRVVAGPFHDGGILDGDAAGRGACEGQGGAAADPQPEHRRDHVVAVSLEVAAHPSIEHLGRAIQERLDQPFRRRGDTARQEGLRLEAGGDSERIPVGLAGGGPRLVDLPHRPRPLRVARAGVAARGRQRLEPGRQLPVQEHVAQMEPHGHRAGVEPGLTPRPSPDVGRIEEPLSHRLHVAGEIGGGVDLEGELPGGADQQPDRALDLVPAGRGAVELRRRQELLDHPGHLHVALGVDREGVDQTPLECAVRIARPEEGDEPARHEPGRSGMGHEDVGDVVQPERTASPQDRLGPAIVTLRDEAGDQAVAPERPVQAGGIRPVGHDHAGRRVERPAGQGAGDLPDVRLAVVAHPEGEELAELAGEILVVALAGHLLHVEIEHHGGVAQHGVQEPSEVPQRVASEHRVLLVHRLRDQHLPVRRGEVPVPEQGHDLPERPGCAHHLAQPPRAQVVHLVRVACGGAPVVVGQHVRRRVGPATLRIEPGVSDPVGRGRQGCPGGIHDQRLHRLLSRHRGQAGHGLRSRAERGATQQMGGGGGVPGVGRVLSSGHRSSRSGYEITWADIVTSYVARP